MKNREAAREAAFRDESATETETTESFVTKEVMKETGFKSVHSTASVKQLIKEAEEKDS